MLRTTMHEFLAKESSDFTIELFERRGFRQLACKALRKAGRWQQRDCPLGSLFVVWIVIALTLHRTKSYPNILTAMLGLMREAEPELSLRAVEPNSICGARARVGYEPLEDLFHRHAARIVPKPSFLGFRTYGVDGVRLTVPNTPLNEWASGRPEASRGEAAFPQVLAIALVDTQGHRVRDVGFTDCHDGERPGCEQLLHRLRKGDLVFWDRGFAAVWLFKRSMATGANFVGRIPANWKPEHLKSLGKGDSLVRVQGWEDVPGTMKENGKGPKQRLIALTLRMIEFEIELGKPVRLLTDLLDPRRYPARKLALGHHERWESELTYDELKTHLATVTHGTLHTVLRSKTPEGVLQEAYGMFLGYNLMREVIAEAAEAHGIPPREISFVEAVDVIKEALPRFERALHTGSSRHERERLVRQLFDDIAAVRLDRPRRKRVYDRVIKQQMSNFKLKRSHHGQKFRDFPADLRLGRQGAPNQDLRP
ncbi:MAG: IS4 family transposase [Candidatus Riflebacteria bacterium]|nr:IS4 family transposase [Candidatus Riflebacteria bacterium]